MKKLFFFLAIIFAAAATTHAQDKENPEFTKVETPAEFPGGKKIFDRYVERKLDQSVPKNMGAPVGVYEVTVKFKVDKEGNVSEVKALTNHGYEMEYTAEQLIKKGPKWIPGTQNGRQVVSFRTVVVVFKVD